MYSRNTFGDFYPIDSFLHRINPIIKFINFFICVILIIGTNSLELHVFALVLVVLMMIFSNVPLKFYFNSLYSLRLILLILLFFFASIGFSLQLCLIYFIKIFIGLEYLNIIIYTTSSSELYYAIERILIPFNILSINTSKASLMIVNVIKFIPLLITTEYKILKTQASKGIDYHHSDFTGRFYAWMQTLKSTFRACVNKIHKISEASNLRMFDAKKKRTNLRVNYVGFNDLVLLSFHVALIVGYIFEKGLIV